MAMGAYCLPIAEVVACAAAFDVEDVVSFVCTACASWVFELAQAVSGFDSLCPLLVAPSALASAFTPVGLGVSGAVSVAPSPRDPVFAFGAGALPWGSGHVSFPVLAALHDWPGLLLVDYGAATVFNDDPTVVNCINGFLCHEGRDCLRRRVGWLRICVRRVAGRLHVPSLVRGLACCSRMP